VAVAIPIRVDLVIRVALLAVGLKSFVNTAATLVQRWGCGNHFLKAASAARTEPVPHFGVDALDGNPSIEPPVVPRFPASFLGGVRPVNLPAETFH
jgi:hypothetical protein